MEISDELDKLETAEDNFNILKIVGKGDKVLIPKLTEGEIDYEETEIKEGIINDFISEYWKEIVEKKKKIFKKSFDNW